MTGAGRYIPDHRLRVLAFTTLFPNPAAPTHGIFVQNRLTRLAELCDVTVVAPIRVATPWRRAIPPQRFVGSLRVFHPTFSVVPGLLKGWDGDLLFHQSLGQIRSLIEGEPFDVIDAHYAYPDGWAAWRLAQRLDIPFVLTVRGSDLNVLARRGARRGRIRTVLSEAAAVIAVSESLKSQVRALTGRADDVRVIRNGVDLSAFPRIERGLARERLDWPREAYGILFVGHLEPVKGPDILVDALAILMAQTDKPVFACVVGAGSMKTRLEAEVVRNGLEGRIRFVGARQQTELPLFFNAADVLCLSSRNEGCPNVVLEAFSCGVPVAATAVGGVPELIDQGVNGVLASRPVAAELASALHDAMTRVWDRSAICSSRVLRDWSDVARDHAQVLRQVQMRQHELTTH
jgi:teichuronic acid biosynthesis glycosyltransferase TuaC